MKEEFTSNDRTYQVAGPNNDSLGQAVVLTNLPEIIEYQGIEFRVKKSHHVTLVPAGNLAKRYGIKLPDFAENVVADFKNHLQTQPINFSGFRNEFRLAEQGDRKTLVVMCTVAGLDEFYLAINAKYGLQLKTPPTHVTLYTREGGPGIFLIDQKDIDELTTAIENPGISQLALVD